MGKIIRRKSKVYRERVEARTMKALENALERHWENGCHDIHFQQERGTPIWTVEATKFIKEDE